ncbi:hypothetical protein F441_00309, partial [Phytophthora nicotianae CJ01A1]
LKLTPETSKMDFPEISEPVSGRALNSMPRGNSHN